MKNYFFIVLVCLIAGLTPKGALAQASFKPDRKLLKTKTWAQVSPLRFEDDYLYVAVEWRSNQYVLLDKGVEDKVIFSAADYKEVHKAIKKIAKERFKPHINLMKKDFWTRVSMFRFDCNPLEIWVEWEHNEYVLYVVSDGKKELARSADFIEIEHEIRQHTISKSF